MDPADFSGHSLFEAYPGLSRHLPWTRLVNAPTPVEELGSSLGFPEGKLWVKRDDLTAGRYGGNKVRKLEYLLGDAESRGRKSLITIGGLGSNHSMATAFHGPRKGFKVQLCLYDQPVNEYVRKNLKGFLAAGAKVHYCTSKQHAKELAREIFTDLERRGEAPYIIPAGGTRLLSHNSHVSAGLELAGQVTRGELPLPDTLFIATGTCGTISGLIAGVKLAGLPTRVVGVRIINAYPAYPYIIRNYVNKILKNLRQMDQDVPALQVEKSDIQLLTNYLGDGYGMVTEEGKRAVEAASSRLSLETTYTGKTLAACLDYCQRSASGEKVLFWNSYNSVDFEKSASFDGLPQEILDQLQL